MRTLPLLPRRIIRPTHMLLHIRTPHPRTPILLKRLNPRLELGLLQRIIVNRANARDAGVREAAAASIHEGPADAAEAVFHVIPRRDGVFLAEAREFGFAARVCEVAVFDDEVGGEHAGEMKG